MVFNFTPRRIPSSVTFSTMPCRNQTQAQRARSASGCVTMVGNNARAPVARHAMFGGGRCSTHREDNFIQRRRDFGVHLENLLLRHRRPFDERFDCPHECPVHERYCCVGGVSTWECSAPDDEQYKAFVQQTRSPHMRRSRKSGNQLVPHVAWHGKKI